jgi:hypothetical protein
MKRHGRKNNSGGDGDRGVRQGPSDLGSGGCGSTGKGGSGRKHASRKVDSEAGAPAKRVGTAVLHQKHRPSAIPAGAWALLGGRSDRSGTGAMPGEFRQDGNDVCDSPGYLPPARPGSGAARPEREVSARGHDEDETMWEWNEAKRDKDSSQRAFTGALNRILAQADVLLEVLDVRDPDGCRTRKIEEFVHARRPELHIVLVLNKIDLVPASVSAAWVRYLKAFYPVVLFKSGTRVRRGKSVAHARVRPDAASDKDLGTSDCVGAEQLLQVQGEAQGVGRAGTDKERQRERKVTSYLL